jgi:glycerophosphoryl diester phosphodiesterase
MNKIVLALACAAVPLASTAAGLNTLHGDAPLVLAHRGTTGYLPEHTPGGYELAVKMGADYIEPDLQLTSDGVLVAMHDDTLTRTTNVATLYAQRNGSYRVSDFTLAEIKTLTVKPVGTASTSYPGFTPSMADPFKVPTFQEVITLAKQQSALAGREVGIYPEAKQADPLMEDLILQTLIANGYKGTDKVFIQSFSADTIKSIHDKQAALGADFKLIVLNGSIAALNGIGLENLNDYADGLGVSITGTSRLTPSFIAAAHGAGLLVHGYTFGTDPASYLSFYEAGIDGVFSNYVDIALATRADFLAAAVPEPSGYGLMALGLFAVGAVVRRRATGS